MYNNIMINEDKKFSSLHGTEKTTGDKVQKKSKVRRVLGIDPGLANTGFGVVDYSEFQW